MRLNIKHIKILTILLLILMVQFVKAEDNKRIIDSLLKEFKSANDSTQFKLCNYLLHYTAYTDVKVANKYSDLQISTAKKLLPDNFYLQNAFLNKGVILYSLGDLKLSNAYFDSALLITKPTDSTQLSRLYNNKGNNFRDLGEYDSSIFYNFKAIDYTNNNDYRQKAFNFGNLNVTYSTMREFKKSLEYTRMAIYYGQKCGDPSFLTHIYSNTATLFSDLGKYDSAKIYISKSQKIAIENEFEDYIVQNQISMGNIFLTENNLDSAKFYLEKAHLKALKINNSFLISNSEIILMKFYNKNEEVDKALEIANKLHQIHLNTKNMQVEKNTLLTMSKIFEKKNNFKFALHYYKKYVNAKDSIIDFDMKKEFAKLETKYKTNQKEIELRETKLKLNYSETIIWFIIGTLALLVIAIIIITNLYLKKRMAYRKLIAKNIESANEKYNNIKSPNEVTEKQKAITHKLEIALNEKKIYINPNLTINKLAMAVNTNRTELSEVIRINYDKTYPNLINELRINHAIRLLSETKKRYSIDAIAKDSGFKSNSNFYKLFKESTGLTPSAFQNISN